MTIKESIILALTEIGEPANHNRITEHIIAQKHYDFGNAKTPSQTISARLGGFIRDGDNRVKRVKEGNGYVYFLANQISKELDDKKKDTYVPKLPSEPAPKAKKNYAERDLHVLLSSYLNKSQVFAKTIYHEQSKNGRDNNQTWTHPDMIGVEFLKLESKVSQTFLKSINRVDTFKMSSYEIKREIKSDAELKKYYFQAVSNSSWANYGYLVAFSIADDLYDELERLNQSFGIGIIVLKDNLLNGKMLLPAKYRDLDFTTIDKLSKMNTDFEQFIGQTERMLTAEDKYYRAIEKDFSSFCDKSLKYSSELEEYCRSKNIPLATMLG